MWGCSCWVVEVRCVGGCVCLSSLCDSHAKWGKCVARKREGSGFVRFHSRSWELELELELVTKKARRPMFLAGEKRAGLKGLVFGSSVFA